MRPVNKGSSPYSSISQYQEALPYLEERLGCYCSYCGLPICHVPEVEHVISKSKEPASATKWENLLLGCKYCNTRKSNVIDSDNVNAYLWPDIYNTALAFRYDYGAPQINSTALLQIDPTGAALTKAENLFHLVKLSPLHSGKTDRRTYKRNETYQKALIALDRWKRTGNEDMKNQIIDTALFSGFFSIWTTVFMNEPEILNALIKAFPGTEKTCFDEYGLPKPILVHVQVSCPV